MPLALSERVEAMPRFKIRPDWQIQWGEDWICNGVICSCHCSCHCPCHFFLILVGKFESMSQSINLIKKRLVEMSHEDIYDVIRGVERNWGCEKYNKPGEGVWKKFFLGELMSKVIYRV